MKYFLYLWLATMLLIVALISWTLSTQNDSMPSGSADAAVVAGRQPGGSSREHPARNISTQDWPVQAGLPFGPAVTAPEDQTVFTVPGTIMGRYPGLYEEKQA